MNGVAATTFYGRTAMKLTRRKFLYLAAGATGLPACSQFARAQAYPTRPIRIVVPFPPGGGYDIVARQWSDKMKSLLGTIVVENMGGGGSSLGAAAVARARPDGYTLLVGGTIPHVNETLLKSRPLYDPIKDLDPISCISFGPFAIAINPSLPARTLKEFIAYAKANPGKLSYGHSGVGSINHLTGELFKSLAGIPEIVAGPLSGCGAGDCGPDQRTNSHGGRGRVRAGAGISSFWKIARPCRDDSRASCRGT
jgi:tripartite-type tricarboxylate transporter receptor subunit TctC